MPIRKPPTPVASEQLQANEFKRRHSLNATEKHIIHSGSTRMIKSGSNTRKHSVKRGANHAGNRLVEFSSTAASVEGGILNVTTGLGRNLGQTQTAVDSRDRSFSTGMRHRNISDSNLQTTKNNYSSIVLDATMESHNHPNVMSNRSSLVKFLHQEDQLRRDQNS